MLSFKTYFVLIFSLLLCTFLQAELPNPKVGQSPPICINIGDTSSVVLSELKLQSPPTNYSVNEIVEDTILPPCDILFFKSGKLEYCKIIESTPTTISYKMCDYVDGPTVIVNKSTVHKIRFANGKEEIISSEQQPTKNAYVKARKDPLAKLAFIFGLSAAAIVLLFGVAFVPLILAGLVLGIISLAKIGRRKGELRGKGSAIVGIILCGLVLLLLIATLL